MNIAEAIEPDATPSGTGCVECLETGTWWFHLRRCGLCGHIGCCDSSPSQHATGHFHSTGHRVMRSFEPGEDWWWDFEEERTIDGPSVADPQSHPIDQPSPGPAGAVPENWRSLIR